MFVYVIVCNDSLKIYVGQHKGGSLERYLQQKHSRANHESGKQSHLYNAMRKHPRDSWSIYPLVSGIEVRAELDELEKHFIRVLKTQHPDVGYNICDGGEGFTGPHSGATKRRISKRMKVVMLGNEHGKGNAGIPHPKSEEFRRQVSKTLTGRKKSKLHAQRIGDGHRGLKYHYTEDALKRMREGAAKGRASRWGK
jgi:GIY-YIG catalytic domain